ncbi:MAG: hypothetical protein JW900_12480 [Anaerolineae bacterium]|nr:hypothetical protein [Anaerolineae bacterium]
MSEAPTPNLPASVRQRLLHLGHRRGEAAIGEGGEFRRTWPAGGPWSESVSS